MYHVGMLQDLTLCNFLVFLGFISQRCANVNRNRDIKSNEDDAPKIKRNKIEAHLGKHQYFNSIILDDTVAFNRNVKKLSSELAQPHPVPETLEELM